MFVDIVGDGFAAEQLCSSVSGVGSLREKLPFLDVGSVGGEVCLPIAVPRAFFSGCDRAIFSAMAAANVCQVGLNRSPSLVMKIIFRSKMLDCPRCSWEEWRGSNVIVD